MVRKAVIPAAGFGTRFLPAAKSQPKEMLPIVDTPTIQYVVEEAVASGITDILMIIGKGKRAIEEHFDRNFELEQELANQGKEEELAAIRRISELANIHFIWQKELTGLGHAVSYARNHVGNEPFAVLLGDTVVESETPVTRQLMDIFNLYQAPVVALEAVDRSKVGRYGVIDAREAEKDLYLIHRLVEKPDPAQAPSNLVIAGRYIFTPDIFEFIDRTPPGKNGEIQLTDAMHAMLSARAMYGLHFHGKRYDIGNKLDFLKTNILLGLKRPDLHDDLQEFIREIAAELE
ncbi:MAG: UTP--glucose-1-phosphate uridylyltransferase GalU [Armatimonadota bacterium]